MDKASASAGGHCGFKSTLSFISVYTCETIWARLSWCVCSVGGFINYNTSSSSCLNIWCINRKYTSTVACSLQSLTELYTLGLMSTTLSSTLVCQTLHQLLQVESVKSALKHSGTKAINSKGNLMNEQEWVNVLEEKQLRALFLLKPEQPVFNFMLHKLLSDLEQQ